MVIVTYLTEKKEILSINQEVTFAKKADTTKGIANPSEYGFDTGVTGSEHLMAEMLQEREFAIKGDYEK